MKDVTLSFNTLFNRSKTSSSLICTVTKSDLQNNVIYLLYKINDIRYQVMTTLGELSSTAPATSKSPYSPIDQIAT